MRFPIPVSLPAMVAAAATACAATIGMAHAGNGVHDHVYADTFGNLVVQSPYGYKRIIVGEGRLARQLQNYTRGGQPDVVYADPELSYERSDYIDNCYRPPVLLKGRSYMYGLPDGVIPEPSGRCPQD